MVLPINVALVNILFLDAVATNISPHEYVTESLFIQESDNVKCFRVNRKHGLLPSSGGYS
jgi:hypothetical protein